MHMDLENLYYKVEKKLAQLDFARIWPGFRMLKFALYDSEKCFFDGRYVEKTDAFCANTSIEYQGEQIAIWMVAEELDLSVLTSKIVHEMFHGYQKQQGWDCWANEMEALYRYQYSQENLSIKLRENALLLQLLEHFDEKLLQQLLAHRKLRSEKFPYELFYESMVEEIEGSANFVEWQVLRQLNEQKANALVERMGAMITKTENLFPIRISGYYIGALMIHALRRAWIYPFESAQRPVILPILRDIQPSDGMFSGKELLSRTVTDAITAFYGKTDAVIRAALERNEVVLNGPLELVGVNIYDAGCYRGYITSTYFVMYRDGGKDRMIPGDFVIRMRDERTIDCVYRWERHPET